jgi:hypothetical protein
MSSKIKWILAALMALSVVIIAQATAINNYYMPFVRLDPTLTPTPTPTQKPTECINQVFPVSKLKVCFTDIVYKPTGSSLDEWVKIKNLGNSAVEMEDWRIVSDSSSATFKYIFPKFTLSAGQTVKVWTKIGTNSSSQLYMNRDVQFWKDNGDCGYLKDDTGDTGKKINSFCYSTNRFFAPAQE